LSWNIPPAELGQRCSGGIGQELVRRGDAGVAAAAERGLGEVRTTLGGPRMGALSLTTTDSASAASSVKS